MRTRSRLVSEWEAFLKGHDDFSRKKPKDGISGTTRLEYGTHPPTQHLVPGGDEWEAFPWQHPSERFSSLWRGVRWGQWPGAQPRKTRGSGVAAARGPAPPSPLEVCFPAVMKGLGRLPRATPKAWTNRSPRPRRQLRTRPARFRWLARRLHPPGRPLGVRHRVVLCVCHEADPTLLPTSWPGQWAV